MSHGLGLTTNPGRRRTMHDVLPDFLEEMAQPSRRQSLKDGIWSGYGLAALFGLLAFVAGVAEIVPHRPAFYVLVGIKLLTNTLNWWSLERDWGVRTFQLTNTLADLVVMTGAIYFTGGALSPLLSIYVILVAILAFLANPGVTFTAATLAWSMHALTCGAVYFGLVPYIAPPGMTDVVALQGWQLVVALAYAALLLGATGTATTLLVRERRGLALADRGVEELDPPQNLLDQRFAHHGGPRGVDLVGVGRARRRQSETRDA